MFGRLYELLNKSNWTEYEKCMFKLAADNLRMQSNVWHLNSPKKVAACIYLKERSDYIVAQNIGISKVTGTLCAERAAVAVAIAKYPDLKTYEITDILTLCEDNPILPCGVCCEWLYKINPDMNLLTLKSNDLLKIRLKNYYGDESSIEHRYCKK